MGLKTKSTICEVDDQAHWLEVTFKRPAQQAPKRPPNDT